MRKKTQRNIIIVLMVLLILSLSFNSYLFFNKEEFEKVAINSVDGVVSIITDKASGSGVIVREDGIILTNYHVIEDAKKISVRTRDKRIYNGEIIGQDPEADVAVIKVNGSKLPILKLGDSDKIKIGEKVIAIGRPYGLEFTVTSGIISGEHRDAGPISYKDFLQTDASINPGNSGGPLLNLKGEVIGVNTFIISGKDAGELGFAIPINLAKRIMDDLLKSGEVKRGYFGITVQDILEIDKDGNGRLIDGTLVMTVVKGSAADKAGLRRGDIIKKINNMTMENSNFLRNYIAWLEPGREIDIEIIRNDTNMNLELIPDERPKFEE